MYLGFTKLDVRHFIPLPHRCFRCQIFGHSIGRVAVKRRVPIVVNCFIDSASCEPHLSDSPTCSSYFFEKTALEIQAIEKLTFQSARQRARALPYRYGLSYTDILNRGIGPSRPGRRVQFSHPCLPLLPLLRLQNSYVSNERLFIALRLSRPLALLIGLLLLLLLFL